MIKRVLMCLTLGISLLTGVPGVFGQDQDDPTLLLDLGRPSVRGRTLDISPGTIYSSQSGASVTFDRMIRDLGSCRYVFIGESHNSLAMHDIQLAVIRGLRERGGELVVGLEMYPVTDQEPLTKWSLGLLTNEEFLAEGRWYVNWNFNFGYYRKIFEYCKEMSIPLRALNVPRDIISRVRLGGWESLSEDQKNLVPAPDLTQADHKRLIRAVFSSTELPPQMKGAGLDMMFEGLYRSQVAWDETMAANARQAFQVGKARVVVLAGSGHLLYHLGINFRVSQKDPSPSRTIVCVSVPSGSKGLKVSRGLADYIWAIPEEARPAFPEIGLAFKRFGGLDNLVVDRKPIDGAASAADFDKGDVILSVDGKAFSDINALRTYLAGFGWDEEVKFRFLRAGQEKEVILKLVQPPPKEPAK